MLRLNLSQAGQTRGLEGTRSSLVGEVFRLAKRSRSPWLLLENVPFMLQLNGGGAMRRIVDALEELGYRWAWRVVDTNVFGLPQRRERVFLVASRLADPADVLLADDSPFERPATAIGRLAHGFYWTEGRGGLGWAVDAIPTLKNGSAVGIPSPPAILMPNGSAREKVRHEPNRLGWQGPIFVETLQDQRLAQITQKASEVRQGRCTGSVLMSTKCRLRPSNRAALGSFPWRPTNCS